MSIRLMDIGARRAGVGRLETDQGLISLWVEIEGASSDFAFSMKKCLFLAAGLGFSYSVPPAASWSLGHQAVPEVSAVVGIVLYFLLLYFPLFLCLSPPSLFPSFLSSLLSFSSY